MVVTGPKGHLCFSPSLQHLDSATCLLPQSGATATSQPAVKTGASGQMDITNHASCTIAGVDFVSGKQLAQHHDAVVVQPLALLEVP